MSERAPRARARLATASVPALLLGLGVTFGIATAPASADILPVTAGDDWSTIAARAKPGDEIVLGEGIHRPAVLEGLAGTPDAPIVIRPAKAGALAEIAPDREAIKFVDARHVRVERILVRSARRAGIVVEGTAPDACRDV
ncbi:MAG: Chondroitinase, partial [Planctomycetota bacterium]